MNVLIVGSATTKIIENTSDYDCIYVANSSISRIPKSCTTKIVHVCSSNMFDTTLFSQYPHLIERHNSLFNRSVDELFLYPSFSSFVFRADSLIHMNYRYSTLSRIGRYRFTSYIIYLCGLQPYLQSLLKSSSIDPHSNFLLILKNIVRYILFIFFMRPLSPHLLPSTGALAIVLAITRHKFGANFFCDGIMINSGSVYYNNTHYSLSKVAHFPFDPCIHLAASIRYGMKSI